MSHRRLTQETPSSGGGGGGRLGAWPGSDPRSANSQGHVTLPRGPAGAAGGRVFGLGVQTAALALMQEPSEVPGTKNQRLENTTFD